MQPESGNTVRPDGQWQFTPDQGQPASPQPPPQMVQSSDDVISWSASEFVAYQKNGSWYMLILIIVLVLAGIIFLITKDLISAGTTIIIGVLFMAFASRKPRVLTYSISDDGIQIGDKLYQYASMRSFALIDEGSLSSISLLPMQRFMPAISMYYEPQDESKIVAALGSYLPQEQRKQELIDRLMHKIRF